MVQMVLEEFIRIVFREICDGSDLLNEVLVGCEDGMCRRYRSPVLNIEQIEMVSVERGVSFRRTGDGHKQEWVCIIELCAGDSVSIEKYMRPLVYQVNGFGKDFEVMLCRGMCDDLFCESNHNKFLIKVSNCVMKVWVETYWSAQLREA